MRKEEVSFDIIMRFFKLVITATCVLLTIGLMVVEPESFSSALVDVYPAYVVLVVIEALELVKKLFTTK